MASKSKQCPACGDVLNFTSGACTACNYGHEAGHAGHDPEQYRCAWIANGRCHYRATFFPGTRGEIKGYCEGHSVDRGPLNGAQVVEESRVDHPSCPDYSAAEIVRRTRAAYLDNTHHRYPLNGAVAPKKRDLFQDVEAVVERAAMRFG